MLSNQKGFSLNESESFAIAVHHPLTRKQIDISFSQEIKKLTLLHKSVYTDSNVGATARSKQRLVQDKNRKSLNSDRLFLTNDKT